MLEYRQIKSDDMKTAFLQQPNQFLSYDLMFYMLLHDFPYFKAKIQPLLDGRSEDLVLDYFFMFFADSLHINNFAAAPEHKEKLEAFWVKYVATDGCAFNAVEIVALLYMLSFYQNVDKAVLHLYNQEIKPNIGATERYIFEQLSTILNNEKDKPERREAPRAAGERRYEIDTTNVIQSDALYEEILWFESNKEHEYEQIPWTRYWSWLLQHLIKKGNPTYDASKLQFEVCIETSLFEVLVCGSKQAVRLACVFNGIKDKQIQQDDSGEIICKIEKTDALITVDCRIRGEPRVANQYFTLQVEMTIFNYAQTTENMHMEIKFPPNCYSELLEQIRIYDVKLPPNRQRKINFGIKVYAETDELLKFNIEIIAGPQNLKFEEEDQKVDYHVLRDSVQPEHIITYLLHANDGEKRSRIQTIIQSFYDGQTQILKDRKFCESLILFTTDEQETELGFISYLVHQGDFKVYEHRHVERLITRLLAQVRPMLLDQIVIKLKTVQISPRRIYLHYETAQSFIDASFENRDALVEELAKWLLLISFGHKTEKMLLQTVYLLIVVQEFNLALDLLNQTQQSIKQQIFKIYCGLATGKHVEAKQTRDQLVATNTLLSIPDQKLLKQCDNYFRELAGERVFQTNFSASLSHNTVTFQKQPDEEVVIGFYQLNPFNYSEKADFSALVPTRQFKTKEGVFQIPADVQGMFQICCVLGHNSFKFGWKSTKIPVKIDTQNGIIQVDNGKLNYVQVKYNDAFYKDGFTDVNQLFDYFNVSDQQVPPDAQFQIIIQAESGECDVIDGVVGGQARKQRE